MDSVELLRILDCIKELSTKVESLSLPSPKNDFPPQSPQINELLTALAKAQAEFKVASEDSINPHFKSRYSKLADLVAATRPALTKFGLSVIQQIFPNDDGQLILNTILGHSSGQYISSRLRIIPAKNDVQGFGSHLTYLKRYAYSSLIVCVSADDKDDDDGEIDVAPLRYKDDKGTALNSKYHPKKESSDTITKEQIEDLEYEISEYPDILEMILEGFKIQALADMPKNLYQASAKRVREIKALRNGARK